MCFCFFLWETNIRTLTNSRRYNHFLAEKNDDVVQLIYVIVNLVAQRVLPCDKV